MSKNFNFDKKNLIGVIHLPPLPGFIGHPGMSKVIEKALTDLETLEVAGFDGALVENDGDHPPHVGQSDQITRYFREIMSTMVTKAKISLGLEILYDMAGTIELASKVKADFVRLDVFVDSGKTKYGFTIPSEAQGLVKLRDKLWPDLLLFTDVHVKHLSMVELKTLDQSVKEAITAGSDAIIITGVWTGREPEMTDCITAKMLTGKTPVFIGSGLSVGNINKFFPLLDGGIVATSIKSGEYLDLDKAKQLVKLMTRFSK